MWSSTITKKGHAYLRMSSSISLRFKLGPNISGGTYEEVDQGGRDSNTNTPSVVSEPDRAASG